MNPRQILTGALLLVALPAAAQWEGTLEMKMTMARGGSGHGKIYLSRSATRTEMEMSVPQMQQAGMGAGMKIATLTRLSDPDKSYLINDARRTYSVLDAKKLREQAAGRPHEEETWTVKKLGGDVVAGFACQSFVLTEEKRKSEVEMCVTRDILGSTAWLAQQGQGRYGSTGMTKALRDAGADGYPVKLTMREKGKPEALMTMELLKASKQSLPASTFEIPAGYKEEDAVSAMLSPEMQQKMNEMLEKLTPEQRRQYEEMMKKRTGGQ